MFKKKHVGRPGEIDVSEYTVLRDGQEFLRVWQGPEGPAICLIDPMVLGPDPFLFGMALADCVQHAAKAYSHVVNLSEAEAVSRVWEGLDAERANPTTGVEKISGKAN